MEKQADWLAAHLDDEKVRVVDIRGYVEKTDLGGGRQKADYLAAREEYDEAHIPGAVYVDWTSDITDPDDPCRRRSHRQNVSLILWDLSASATIPASWFTTTRVASLPHASGGPLRTTATTVSSSSTAAGGSGWPKTVLPPP